MRPSAATVSVQDSQATVAVFSFDGLGPLHDKSREDGSFQVFDKIVRSDDTDDRSRGAAAKAKQLSTVVDDPTVIVVKSKGEGPASYYDRKPSDGIQPNAEAFSFLRVNVDVTGQVQAVVAEIAADGVDA